MPIPTGGTIALQSAVQLRQFGANIFVVDLIGVSLTRELGPLGTRTFVEVGAEQRLQHVVRQLRDPDIVLSPQACEGRGLQACAFGAAGPQHDLAGGFDEILLALPQRIPAILVDEKLQ